MKKGTEISETLLEYLTETGKVCVKYIHDVEKLISDLEVLGYDVSLNSSTDYLYLDSWK